MTCFLKSPDARLLLEADRCTWVWARVSANLVFLSSRTVDTWTQRQWPPVSTGKVEKIFAYGSGDDDEYTALPYGSSPSWPDSFHSTGITISSKHLGGKLNKSPLSRLPSMSSSVAGSSQSHRTEALLSGQIARTEVFHTIHISLLRVNLSILTFTDI